MNLEELTKASDKLVAINSDIAIMEEALKKRKEEARKLAEEVIPDALIELGITEIKLENGCKIQYEKKYYATLPKKDPVKRAKAIAWLKANDLGGIVKETITVPFTPSEADAIAHKWLIAKLDEAEYQYNNEATVHSSTLKATVKEQMEAGKEIPIDLFGIHCPNVTKIVGNTKP